MRELKARDPRSPVTLVSDEAPYARMALPYFLKGEIVEERLATADRGELEGMGVEVLSGRRAISLDPASRTLQLDDGSSLSYENLLLATGCRPVKPDVPGLEGPGVSHFWTLADARALSSTAGPGKDILLLGGGFIAFVALPALLARGCRVTVVEALEHVLPRMLSALPARLVEGWISGRGVAVHTGETLEALERRDGRLVGALRGGGRVEADHVLVATGIAPNVELARQAGIRVETGIVVDDAMRTSSPGVYAAGDCAQARDILGGSTTPHYIQPAAVDQGRVAGAAMAGEEVRYPGSLSMNNLSLMGLDVVAVGDARSEEGTLSEIRGHGPSYRRLVIREGRLVGAVFLGPSSEVFATPAVGMAKGLIQSQAELGRWAGVLAEDPLQLEKAYFAVGAPAAIIRTTLLGVPSRPRRERTEVPVANWPHHGTLVGTV